MDAKIKELKKRVKISKEAKEILLEIGVFILSFALTPVRFLFGTYPFGIALTGACKRQAPFAFAGAALSALIFMEGNAVYVIALVALLGLRLAASFIKKTDFRKTELGQRQGGKIYELLFEETVELKVITTSLVAMGIGIYNVVANGYLYYDAFVLIFFTTFMSIYEFCLCALFEGRGKGAFLLGACALTFCIVYATREIQIYGISLSLCLSYAAVLYISKHLDGIKGGAAGVILGVANGGIVGCVLGTAGISAGFLWGISPYLAVMCSFILSMGFAVSAMGYDAITVMVPELLAASLIMYPILKFELLPGFSFLQRKEEKGMREYHLESKSREQGERLTGLSTAYKDIAKILKNVVKNSKAPDKRGYMEMALEVCEGHCYSCPKHSICWNRDVDTTQKNIDRMGEALFVKRQVSKSNVDEKFLHRCPNIEKIVEELNSKNKGIIESGVKSDKLEICAQGYEATSKIIDAINKADREVRVDKALTDRAIRISAACGFVCNRIEVVGEKWKKIVATGVDVQRSKCTSEILRQEMEKGLGLSLKDVELEQDELSVTLKLESKGIYTMESSAKSHTEDEGSLNGDSYLSFENGNLQYIVICDGMGSGREAHITSSLAVELLSRLLCVVGDKQVALSTLNSIIRARNTECSTTVDLFELDTVSGEGKFVKSGACPSFIKRGENVFRLQSKTAPLGIMKSLDAEELSFTLQEGDVCVMVSDGVIPSRDDGRWLMQYISDFRTSSTDALAKGIMKEAKHRGVKDDLTVVCSVIK